MTAATANAPAPEMATPFTDGPTFEFPVAAAKKLYPGTTGWIDSAGNLTDAPALGAIMAGRIEALADNSAGAAGAIKGKVKPGIYKFKNSGGGDTIAEANRGAVVYGVDNQTVALTDANGTRPPSGPAIQVDSDGVFVACGFAFLAGTSPQVPPVTHEAQRTFHARGVAITNQSVAAFAGVAGGAAVNGITYVQGDVILLAAQTTAKQNGLYEVGVVAGGVAPLSRVASLPTGATYQDGCTVEVGNEGTLLAASTWKSMATGAKVVDTDDPLFYPRTVRATVTLASGTYTLGAAEGLFLFATTGQVSLAQNTNGGTLGTNRLAAPAASRTAGVSGTAAIVVNSLIDAGTVQAADTSTVDVVAVNW